MFLCSILFTFLLAQSLQKNPLNHLLMNFTYTLDHQVACTLLEIESKKKLQKKLYAKLPVVNLPLFEKFRSLVNFRRRPSSSFPIR